MMPSVILIAQSGGKQPHNLITVIISVTLGVDGSE